MNRLRTGRRRNIFFCSGQGDWSPPPQKKIRSSSFFLVSTKHPIQCETGAHFLAVIDRGVRVTGHLPSSTEVKSSWSNARSYSCVLMDCCLIKQSNFTYLPHYIPVTCRWVHIFLFHTHKGTRANTHRRFLTFDCCHFFCTREPTQTAMQETAFNPFVLQAFVRNKQVTALTVLKE